MRRLDSTSWMPVRSPKREAHPASSRGMETQYRSSFLVGIHRLTLMPHCPVSLKRSCEKGMRISAVHPSESHLDARFPHRVVGEVAPVLGVRRVVPVDAHARGGDGEAVRGAPVQVGVERHGQGFDVPHLVAPRHHLGDVRRILVQHAGPNVQGSAVIHEGDLGALGGGGALLGLLLQEVGEEPGLAPRGVVQPSVDGDEVGIDADGEGLLGKVWRRPGRRPYSWSSERRVRRKRPASNRYMPRPSAPPDPASLSSARLPAALRPGRFPWSLLHPLLNTSRHRERTKCCVAATGPKMAPGHVRRRPRPPPRRRDPPGGAPSLRSSARTTERNPDRGACRPSPRGT